MLKDSLTVLGLGFSVVFFGLLSLIGIIYLMSFIVRLVRREKPSVRTHHETVLPEYHHSPVLADSSGTRLTGEKRRETVAAVSAAIAEYMGTEPEGIRIHSIKRVGAESEIPAADRRELIAVISAAIATELGTDVTGIRIHSIRKAA